MSDTFQYRVGFDADTSGLDDAEASVKSLADTLEGLASTTVEIDTDEASAEVKQLVEDVDKLSAQDAVIKLALARNDIAEQVADIAETIEKLDASDPEIDIKMAQGDKLLADIQTIDAKLTEIAGRKADVQVDLANSGQVIGDLEQVESAVNELDGKTAEVRIDTTGATQGVDRISDSARGANSALANMVGNSAQDVGNLGGVAQSAGVAIGQMAEYASDATLAGENLGSALKSMAGVLGPIAALTLGVQVLQTAMGNIAKTKAFDKEQVEGFADAIEDVGVGVQAVNEAITETGKLVALVPSDNIFSNLFGGKDKVDLIEILDSVGVKLSDINDIIESNDPERARQFMAAYFDAGQLSNADALNAIRGLQDQQEAYAAAVEETSAKLRFFASTQETVNDTLRRQRIDADPLAVLAEGTIKFGQVTADAHVVWRQLVDDLRDGQADTINTAQAVDAFSEAMGISKDQVIALAVAQGEGTKAMAGYQQALHDVADAQQAARDAAVDAVALQAARDQVTMFESIAQAQKDASAAEAQAAKDSVIAAAEGIQAWKEHAAAVQEAGIAIGQVVDQVPDIAGAINAEFDKLDPLFEGLKFDVDFKPALETALEGLDSFTPDFQTLADKWSSILTGQPIDLYGNVRADDSEFLDKVSGLRDLFQQGVVNEFEQGGLEAGTTFAQSVAATIANSTGLSIADVYRIMGLPPDGTITTLIAPEVEAQHASQAAAILDALAGTSSDPRIAAMQVQLETGNIDGDIAYVESLLLARELGIPVSLDGIPQSDIDAAQAQIDANSFVATITAQADTDQANAQLDGVAKGILGSIWPGGVRTATITAEAETDAAASEIAAFIAQKRQLVVDAILGTVPSASQIAATIGAVRVPIDYYIRSDPRVNGSRLKAVG